MDLQESSVHTFQTQILISVHILIGIHSMQGWTAMELQEKEVWKD